jgi:hypothetical protein
MNRILFGVLLAAMCGVAAPAMAGEAGAGAEEGAIHFSARSVTIANRELRPGAFNESEFALPTFQLLSFEGENLGGTGFFGNFSGYTSQHLVSDLGEEKAGDLVYGYVGWEDASKNVRVLLGRQLVFAGAPRYVFLDGASTIVRLPMDLRLDAYAGTAAFGAFEEVFQAPTYGGRLAWTPWEWGHIGASFQEVRGPVAAGEGEETEIGAARRSVGVDFSVRKFGPMLWTGSYAYDLLGGGTQEARVDGTYRFNKWLSVYGRGEVRDPLAWLPKTSIFNAFVSRTDGIVGGGFDLRTPGALSVNGGYERFLVGDDQVDGYRGFMDFALRIDADGRYRTGVTVSRLSNGDNGFTQARLYGRARVIDGVSVAGDVDTYFFFRDIRQESKSVMGSLSVRWDAKRGLEVGVDGQVWTNPYYTSQGMGLLTVTLTDEFFRGHETVATKLTWNKVAAAKSSDDGEDEDKAEDKADSEEKSDDADKAEDGDKSDEGDKAAPAPADDSGGDKDKAPKAEDGDEGGA